MAAPRNLRSDPPSEAAPDLLTQWVEIAVAGGASVEATSMPAWWARPASGPPRGGVLVLPEVFGVNRWVRSVAERLAGEGYAALAISTFSRTAPQLDLDYDEAGLALGRAHRDRVTAAQLLADAAAAADWLQRDLGPRPLGCVGFCFGGHLAMLAASLPCFAATCDFYGARVADFRPGGGPPSLEVVADIPGRLWCFRGTADPLIPAEERQAIAAALTQANGGIPATAPEARHRLFVVEGAGHGYLCEARADFYPEAAAEGWQAMLNLFGQSL